MISSEGDAVTELQLYFSCVYVQTRDHTSTMHSVLPVSTSSVNQPWSGTLLSVPRLLNICMLASFLKVCFTGLISGRETLFCDMHRQVGKSDFMNQRLSFFCVFYCHLLWFDIRTAGAS